MRLIDIDNAPTYQSLSKPNNTCEVDLIRREDAIEAVVCHIWHTPDETRKLFNCENYVRDIVEEALKALPSAEPKIIRCKDCKWWEGCRMLDDDNGYCSDGERKEE